jgi:hypothetical protein
MSPKKGKWFEDKSLEAIKNLFPGKVVYPERVVKTDYGGFRKIDISVGSPGDAEYIILECKDSKKIGIAAIDQVIEQGLDVKASRVALITNGKISKTALNKAGFKNVDVFHLVDKKDNRIRPRFFVKVLHHLIWLGSFLYKCFLFGSNLNINAPPDQVFLDNDKSILDLAKRLFNERIFSMEKGKHNYSYDKFNMATRAEIVGIKMGPVENILFEYEVIKKSFLTEVELAKGAGLYDVRRGLFIVFSEEVGFGPLSIEEIAKEEFLTQKTAKECEAAFEVFCYHHYK